MLWISFGIMLLAAVLIVAWPIYRHRRQISVVGTSAMLVVVALSAGLYAYIGTPDADSVDSAPPSIADMVASLDARLQENPRDLDGWKMLGRSYMELDDPPKAIAAFEKAVELEDGSNGETLISLGEAILSDDRDAINGRAGQLFESGLAIAPNSPRGLFYGGFSALQRQDRNLAADRWEALLALSPPPEIRGMLEQRIAEWRGEPAPQSEQPAAPEPAAPAARPVVSVDIQLSPGAAEAIQPSASVFVIARDPAQPSPPLAVSRRAANELPATVPISDADAMIRGRVPSAFAELEIVVRVSDSGQPMAQPGDWFGQGRVETAEDGSISILVDRQVP